MSKNREFILVTPPMFLEQEQVEGMVIKGHVCSRCGGTGWFWDQSGKDAEKRPCPVCMGSGKLDAVVTIKWVPGGK